MGALQLNLLSSPRPLFPPFAMNLVNFLKGWNMAPFTTGSSLTITSSNIPLHVPKAAALLTVPNILLALDVWGAPTTAVESQKGEAGQLCLLWQDSSSHSSPWEYTAPRIKITHSGKGQSHRRRKDGSSQACTGNRKVGEERQQNPELGDRC